VVYNLPKKKNFASNLNVNKIQINEDCVTYMEYLKVQIVYRKFV